MSPALQYFLETELDCADLGEPTLDDALKTFNNLDFDSFDDVMECWWTDDATPAEKHAAFDNVGKELDALIAKHGPDTCLDWLLAR
jgi:hypothetical protein